MLSLSYYHTSEKGFRDNRDKMFWMISFDSRLQISLYELNYKNVAFISVCCVVCINNFIYPYHGCPPETSCVKDYDPSTAPHKMSRSSNETPNEAVSSNAERILAPFFFFFVGVDDGRFGKWVCKGYWAERGGEGNYTAPFLSETPAAGLWYGGKQRLCSRPTYLTSSYLSSALLWDFESSFRVMKHKRSG